MPIRLNNSILPPIMKATLPLPEELHVAELKREQIFREACLAARTASFKAWQLPFAYLSGIAVGVLAYLAQANLLLALAVGASIAALNIATAAAVFLSKTHTALVALIEAREKTPDQ